MRAGLVLLSTYTCWGKHLQYFYLYLKKTSYNTNLSSEKQQNVPGTGPVALGQLVEPEAVLLVTLTPDILLVEHPQQGQTRSWGDPHKLGQASSAQTLPPQS
jgi:hypothetical protein